MKFLYLKIRPIRHASKARVKNQQLAAFFSSQTETAWPPAQRNQRVGTKDDVTQMVLQLVQTVIILTAI